MTYIIIALLVFANVAIANEEVPKYLKGGTITVTLKSGKKYSFSSDEYFVSKRGQPKQEVKIPVLAKESKLAPKSDFSAPAKKKHIISGELLRSNGDLDYSSNASSVSVKNKKEIGVGIMYQYNFHKDLYLGGRVDSNGGTAINLGTGF